MGKQSRDEVALERKAVSLSEKQQILLFSIPFIPHASLFAVALFDKKR